jgi:ribonuclease P protein component
MKLNLLKTETEFAQFRHSKSFQAKSFRVRVVGGRNQNTPRFGFIVPKKVLPKAVDRNLIRRRIKAILTKHAGKLKSVDVLIFPSALALKKPFADLEKEFTDLFSKAFLWK